MANQQKRKINFPIPENMLSSLTGEPVPNEIAKKIIKKFKDEHPSGGHPQTTWSVHFTRKDFLELITMMEDSGANGANVYMGTYADDGSTNPPDQNYTGRNTVVFILTKGGKDHDLINVDDETGILPSDPAAYDHGDLNP